MQTTKLTLHIKIVLNVFVDIYMLILGKYIRFNRQALCRPDKTTFSSTSYLHIEL